MKSSEGNGPWTVMLADDHPLVLRGLSHLLAETHRFEVVGACADGEEARSLLLRKKPDIAVIDLSMPRLGGLEVIAAATAAGAPTRIVLLTASASDADLARAVDLGVWGVLLKDAAADSLCDCLDQIAAGQRVLPPDLVGPAQARIEKQRQSQAELRNLLTPRERDIIVLAGEGLSNKEIARRAHLTEGTVKIHLHNIYQKLGITARGALCDYAALLRGELK